MEKVGVAITTFNSESYFKELYDSLPFDHISELVVVNGGEPYEGTYEGHWIQHEERKWASVARNDGLKHLKSKDMDHYFVIEDDMVLKRPDVFLHYVNASKITGLDYFVFCSNAWHSGPIGNRTPKLKVQYSEDLTIGLFANMCNEFTYTSKRLLEKLEGYDEQFQFTFDLDYVYRASITENVSPFYWFADIIGSDELVMNNPNSISRMNANGERDKIISHNMELFQKKHGNIIMFDRDGVVEKLKNIKV